MKAVKASLVSHCSDYIIQTTTKKKVVNLIMKPKVSESDSLQSLGEIARTYLEVLS